MKAIASLLLLCTLCIGTVLAQTPMIVVQNPNNAAPTGQYTSFADAVAAASAGDYLYMSAGGFSIGTFNLTKRLNIIGAGWNPDSSAIGITILSGYFQLQAGASGGSLEGVYMPDNYYVAMGNGTASPAAAAFPPTNYTIRRCNLFHLNFQWSGAQASGYYIGETIIRHTIVGQWNNGQVYAQNVMFDRCLITGVDVNNSGIQGGCNGILFKNCVISKGDNTSTINCWTAGCNPIYNCTFINCVLIADDIFGSGSGNILQNCLMLVDTNPNGEVAQNSNPMSSPARTDIFQNVTSSVFSATFNYRLKSTCVGKNAGTDGFDVGMYGTAKPFRAKPSNPVWGAALPNPMTTNSSGQLVVPAQVTVGQ